MSIYTTWLVVNFDERMKTVRTCGKRKHGVNKKGVKNWCNELSRSLNC